MQFYLVFLTVPCASNYSHSASVEVLKPFVSQPATRESRRLVSDQRQHNKEAQIYIY